MGRANAKNSTVCGHCGETRKKFPSSWTLNNCTAYCPKCWEQVKCSSCGHHDPKGGLVSGSWACRRCQHEHRVKSHCILHEDCHRVIIEDGNGAALSAATSDPADLNVCSEEREDADQLDEEDDEVSALPNLALAARQAQRDVSHIILLLDASGSMRSVDVVDPADQSKKEELLVRFDAALICAAQFVQQHSQMYSHDAFSLATFSDSADAVFSLQSGASAQAGLKQLTCHISGGTSYGAALRAAAELTDLRPSTRSHIVMLSDGRPADTKAALEFFQTEILNGKKAGIHLHGIGFGGTVQSFAPLQQLACLSGGTFELSSCSKQGLCKAFSSVSSTITSISTGSFTLEGPLGIHQRALRVVHFEPPELGVFGRRGVLRFSASRSTFQYDGASFKKQSWPPADVARRLCPCMRGGMRLVYAFQDKQVVKHEEEGSWMVAKSSRFVDEISNSTAVVETHAKSTAVARYFAACFNEKLKATVPEGVQEATLFFVPCFVYNVENVSCTPLHDIYPPDEPQAFAGERYLPGAFLKYNSNNGYVGDDRARHHEVLQAFTHFTFENSRGTLLVADLQGVARESEALLTDPQVLSLDGSFGPGDLRARGICACLAAHRCGPTCRRLGLTPVNGALLRQLGASRAGIGRTRRSQGSGSRPVSRATSGLSDGWEKLSQPSVPEGEWERIKEKDLEEFALSDGGWRSSQGSASSWAHMLDM